MTAHLPITLAPLAAGARVAFAHLLDPPSSTRSAAYLVGFPPPDTVGICVRLL